MPSEEINRKSEILKVFINNLSDFEMVSPDIPYGHMGATITDAILQAGINYESVVKPRVKKVRSFREAKTTSGFRELLRTKGPSEVLDWTDPEKIQRIKGLVDFLVSRKIETENDLKKYLLLDKNVELLKRLHGVGNKTADYLKNLAGIPTTAIDRHILNFLALAGVEPSGYNEAKEIIHDTADKMAKSRRVLDHSIWKYMSSKKPGVEKVCGVSNRSRTPGGIGPHDEEMKLSHSFAEAWDFLQRQDHLTLETSTKKEFCALAAFSKSRRVIKFFQNRTEYGRAYECCWGHYYNCNRTRIGMYVLVLDDALKRVSP